ncbi:MAG: stage II sporulation protein P [Firmicutes bacterium]|nr:stage II sporulation protein P [Bacillota bacterium]
MREAMVRGVASVRRPAPGAFLRNERYQKFIRRLWRFLYDLRQYGWAALNPGRWLRRRWQSQSASAGARRRTRPRTFPSSRLAANGTPDGRTRAAGLRPSPWGRGPAREELEVPPAVLSSAQAEEGSPGGELDWPPVQAWPGGGGEVGPWGGAWRNAFLVYILLLLGTIGFVLWNPDPSRLPVGIRNMAAAARSALNWAWRPDNVVVFGSRSPEELAWRILAGTLPPAGAAPAAAGLTAPAGSQAGSHMVAPAPGVAAGGKEIPLPERIAAVLRWLSGYDLADPVSLVAREMPVATRIRVASSGADEAPPGGTGPESGPAAAGVIPAQDDQRAGSYATGSGSSEPGFPAVPEIQAVPGTALPFQPDEPGGGNPRAPGTPAPGAQPPGPGAPPAGPPQAETRRASPGETSSGPWPPAVAGALELGRPLARRWTGPWGQGPQILIYHTHSSEAYHGRQVRHNKSQDYVWGRPEGVVSMGDLLTRVLQERYGISVTHSRDFHDIPDITTAYTRSRQTVQRYLARYPGLQMILDVHRDGIPTESSPDEGLLAASIRGIPVARVEILVGKGNPNNQLHNPHWRDNLALAEILDRQLNALYPGMSRGIVIRQDWPFNMQLSPRALLVELGDHYNTRDEAMRAAVLLADAVAGTLWQIKQQQRPPVLWQRP